MATNKHKSHQHPHKLKSEPTQNPDKTLMGRHKFTNFSITFLNFNTYPLFTYKPYTNSLHI